jgi:hypothetical protein
VFDRFSMAATVAGPARGSGCSRTVGPDGPEPTTKERDMRNLSIRAALLTVSVVTGAAVVLTVVTGPSVTVISGPTAEVSWLWRPALSVRVDADGGRVLGITQFRVSLNRSSGRSWL